MKETLLDKWRAALGRLYLNRNVMTAWYAKPLYHVLGRVFRLWCHPLLISTFPWADPDDNSITCVPINSDVTGLDKGEFPFSILDHFIEKASHRVILNVCPCRMILGCKNYPADIGCIMMGDAAVHIPKKISREVSVAEAKEHLRRAVNAGLIPTTGRARIDRDFFTVPGHGRLLTLCLCCECCSVTRFFRHIPPERLDRMHPPVEGMSISVSGECDGCGQCVEKCHLDAIKMDNGRAVIGRACRVCGRCALFCPKGALTLSCANPAAGRDVIRRIEAVVDYQDI